MNQNIIPITDEQAKAIQEIAKTLGISLETIQKFGGFLYEIVGAPVKDLVDLKIRDPLKIKHFENLIKITEKAQESLKARNIQEPKPVSLVLANLCWKLPPRKAAKNCKTYGPSCLPTQWTQQDPTVCVQNLLKL